MYKYFSVVQMYGLHFYGLVERHSSDKFQEMGSYHEDRTNLRDFCHDNLPYLGTYIRPRLMGTPDLNSKSTPFEENNPLPEEHQNEVEHLEHGGQ